MSDKDLGADAAAVHTAGSSAPEAATARHTEGPWVRTGSGEGLRIMDAHGKSLFGNEAYYPWCSDNEADWDLIAAAPEMYEALRDRVWAEHDDATHWPANSTRDGHSGDFGTCPHQDCLLIAKAEGRS